MRQTFWRGLQTALGDVRTATAANVDVRSIQGCSGVELALSGVRPVTAGNDDVR
jgi:hypothetical protein